jgi:outer membrane protein assembly factor BamB
VFDTCPRGSGADPVPPKATSWPSFRHDLSQSGVATSSLPDDLELLWEVSIGDQVLATAAIVGDSVYVPCLSGELVCLHRKTGEKLWVYKSVEVVEKNSFAPGFKSAPTVAGESIYLGDEEGMFHAIDRRTGEGRWKFSTGGEIKLAWQYETQGYVHCAPAVAEGVTFIAGCDEHLRVIDIKTGQQRFDFPLQTYLIASPAVIGDMLYVGTYASEVVAVDWKKKDVLWRYSTGSSEQPFHSSAAVTDQLVILGGRDKLVHAIDRATGKKAWTFPTRAKVDSSPAVVGDRVFVGSHDGNLYALGLADGKERWKFNAGKPISAGPAIGEGVLVVGSESRDGKVYCFGKK